MKTKEELNALKAEVETASDKFRELTEEELEQVTGGVIPHIPGVGLPFASAGNQQFEIEDTTKKYEPSFYKKTIIDFQTKAR